MQTFVIAVKHGEIGVAEWTFFGEDQAISEPDVVPVLQESEHYSFSIRPVFGEAQYRSIVGDEDLRNELELDADFTRRFGQSVEWRESMYFESARGWTTLHLFERLSPTEEWRRIQRFQVYVQPTKLGEDRFNIMASEMQKLSIGLLVDILGKSRQIISPRRTASIVSFRSKEMELREVYRLWKGLKPLLKSITESPRVVLRLAPREVPYWGEVSLTSAEMRQLAYSGTDPRKHGCLRPVRLKRMVLGESTQIVEHQIVAGLLRSLHARVRECITAIDEHSKSIEKDRQYRDIAIDARPSLYQAVDLPRLLQLAQSRKKAASLRADILGILSNPPFSETKPHYTRPSGTMFNCSVVYRRVRSIVENFYRSSAAWIEDLPGDAFVKVTHRLYEQWVFVSLVEAVRRQGVELDTWGDTLKSISKHRFTIDFERGLGFTGQISDSAWIRIRYEPWILSRTRAQANGDELCHGGARGVPWCPDVLLEFMTGDSLQSAATTYAIAIDCKYTAHIRESHWNRTRKYLEIRSCSSNAQIVRQLWLAYPGPGANIQLNDSAIDFDENGPTCSHNETVQGIIEVTPTKDTGSVTERFVSATLNYFLRSTSPIQSTL